MTQPLGFVRHGVGERRRREIDRVDDMTAKDTTVSGRQLLAGPGEAIFDVSFPATFAQKPTPHFAPELDVGLSPVTQFFPGAQACVVDWNKIKEVEGAFEGYYVGATISVLVFGDDNVRIWLHWSFRGTALRNPVQSLELLEEDV